MKDGEVSITLNRTQVELLRHLLSDAADMNTRNAGEQWAKSEKTGSDYLQSYARVFEKRAATCRFLVRNLSKARDRRRKYINLADELFPMSK